jgi:Ca-activated chloride channel family protein
VQHARSITVTIVIALLLWAAPPVFTQSSAPVFRANANVVVLQVTVTATAGRKAGDLQPEDFTIFEDGVPQPITLFSRADEPVALSLLLDTSASMTESLALAQTAAIGFTRRLRPTDLAEVVTFNEHVGVLQPFTPDTAALEAAIRRASVSGTTSLYTALYVALQELDAVGAARDDIRRHAIVLLSDGADTSSLVGFDDMFDVARRSNVSIYAIGLGAATRPDTQGLNDPADVLKQLARATGGRAVFVERAEQLAPVYAQIADELANQYTLAFTPQAAHRDGKWHDIAVRVNRQNCAARTRSGYLASH